MKILANENFPLSSVNILKSNNFDVLFIGIDFQGISDDEVMNLAISQNRTIITFDSDYGELIFKHGYKPRGGVIFLRWQNYTPSEPGVYLVELLERKDIIFNNMLTVIDRRTIRQRKY